MKYVIGFNQKMALELGIANANQAHIFDLLTTASTWATPVTVGNKVYYWVSRQSVARELEILHLKPDTVYRHLKSLADLGLIDYVKDGKKDCVKITAKGKKYLSDSPMSETDPNHYVGNKSESDQNSEIDPSKSGNRSEKSSEIDPTYPTTNTNPATKDQGKAGKLPAKRFAPPTVADVADYCQQRANGIDPEYFVDYYSTRGWMIGKNKIKDWKACVRTWERNQKTKQPAAPTRQNGPAGLALLTEMAR